MPNGRGCQLRRRNHLYPWNNPQSMSTRVVLVSNKNFDPVTVSQPPRKVKCIAVPYHAHLIYIVCITVTNPLEAAQAVVCLAVATTRFPARSDNGWCAVLIALPNTICRVHPYSPDTQNLEPFQ